MIVSINSKSDYSKASNDCIVRLNPVPGESIPVYIEKEKLILLADSLLGESRTMALLAGPTATGKSSLISGLLYEKNYNLMAQHLGYARPKPPLLLPFHVASIDHPSSLFESWTFDQQRQIVKEPGSFVKVLLEAEKHQYDRKVVIHLPELSRTRYFNQIALLELIQNQVHLPDWNIFLSNVSFIGDGNLGCEDNYQVEDLDPALSRRLEMGLFFTYFEQEVLRAILFDLVEQVLNVAPSRLSDSIEKIIKVTELIKKGKKGGNLTLTAIPNFMDQIKLLKACMRLESTIPVKQLARTYLFKTTEVDNQLINTILDEVYGTPQLKSNESKFTLTY